MSLLPTHIFQVYSSPKRERIAEVYFTSEGEGDKEVYAIAKEIYGDNLVALYRVKFEETVELVVL